MSHSLEIKDENNDSAGSLQKTVTNFQHLIDRPDQKIENEAIKQIRRNVGSECEPVAGELQKTCNIGGCR